MKVLSNLRIALAPLFAVFVLAIAFAAFSPADVSATTVLTATASAEIAPKAPANCTITGQLTDNATGGVRANEVVLVSSDGYNWSSLGVSNAYGIYEGDIPGGGSTTNWQFKVYTTTKHNQWLVTYPYDQEFEYIYDFGACPSTGGEYYINFRRYDPWW